MTYHHELDGRLDADVELAADLAYSEAHALLATDAAAAIAAVARLLIAGGVDAEYLLEQLARGPGFREAFEQAAYERACREAQSDDDGVAADRWADRWGDAA